MSVKGKERASEEEGEEEGLEIEEGETELELEDGEGDNGVKAEVKEDNEEEVEPHPTVQGGDEEVRACLSSLKLGLILETWVPKHVLDRPLPPTREEREAELALLEAQARAGQGTNDPRAKARIRVRSLCILSQLRYGLTSCLYSRDAR